MKLRNVKGPTAYESPEMARRALPVVAASNYQKRVGPGAYDNNDVSFWQYPSVKSKGLGADDVGYMGRGDDSYRKAYSQKLRLDENT